MSPNKSAYSLSSVEELWHPDRKRIKTIVNSIRGVNGSSPGNSPLNSKDQFSASLEKAKGEQKAAKSTGADELNSSDRVSRTGRMVYRLANGDYREHDFTSGAFAKDVENATGEVTDTSNMPEHAARSKVANVFVKSLKNSEES